MWRGGGSGKVGEEVLKRDSDMGQKVTHVRLLDSKGRRHQAQRLRAGPLRSPTEPWTVSVCAGGEYPRVSARAPLSAPSVQSFSP